MIPQRKDLSLAVKFTDKVAAVSVVGQVIMDKNPGITCVVNKTNIIDSTYRNFKMEVLAGEENMVAKVSEMLQSFHDRHILTEHL